MQEAPTPQDVVDSRAPQVGSLAPQAAAADTAAADTSDALTQISDEIGEASRLLLAGEWDLFWSRLYEGLAGLVVDLIPKLFGAIFVFILFYIAYRVMLTVITRVLNRSKRVDMGLQNLLLKTYRVVVLSFIVVMVLAQLGVNVAALLAGLSIVGIAVGFAARDTLENFISGVTIMLDKPFRIGDNVEVDGVFGTVEDITLRSTRLRTLSNQIMVMPNVQMVNQKLLNHTMLPTLRIAIPFGIAYKEFPQQAREVVLALTEGDERLHPDYKPHVVVTGLNDSSVDMELRLFLKNPKMEVPVRFDYIEKVREALREADIEIPFPHLQLFIDEARAFDDSFLMQPRLPRPSDDDRPTA
ncbi:MAG: mechanosensitive ion channel family protein [Rhodothermales bacterium]|nr:mechanosensitive ion channel family protein [Rhodothermales bacterium]